MDETTPQGIPIPYRIDGLGLTDSAFRIYLALARDAHPETGLTQLSKAELGAATRKSVSTVQRGLKELEAAGAIEVTRHKAGHGGYLPNLYRVSVPGAPFPADLT